MRRLLATAPLSVALGLALFVRSPRGWLGLGWLVLTAVGLWRGGRRWAAASALGLLGLYAVSPHGGYGPFWLAASPFNLLPESDLSEIGVGLFYPGPPGRHVRAVTRPLYAEMRETEPNAIHFTCSDVFGLGTGAGHAFVYRPPAAHPPVLIFLHGALGNFQSYLHFWRKWAEPRGWAVVCPTFGFGWWMRPGGAEAAHEALEWTLREIDPDRERILVIGMSNGATGAVRMVESDGARIRWLGCVSPVLEPERVAHPPFSSWGQSHRILVLTGDADVNVGIDSVERGVAAMQGQQVDFQVVPGEDHFLLFSAGTTVYAAVDRLVSR